jgi:hypothetical protein
VVLVLPICHCKVLLTALQSYALAALDPQVKFPQEIRIYLVCGLASDGL